MPKSPIVAAGGAGGRPHASPGATLSEEGPSYRREEGPAAFPRKQAGELAGVASERIVKTVGEHGTRAAQALEGVGQAVVGARRLRADVLEVRDLCLASSLDTPSLREAAPEGAEGTPDRAKAVTGLLRNLREGLSPGSPAGGSGGARNAREGTVLDTVNRLNAAVANVDRVIREVEGVRQINRVCGAVAAGLGAWLQDCVLEISDTSSVRDYGFDREEGDTDPSDVRKFCMQLILLQPFVELVERALEHVDVELGDVRPDAEALDAAGAGLLRTKAYLQDKLALVQNAWVGVGDAVLQVLREGFRFARDSPTMLVYAIVCVEQQERMLALQRVRKIKEGMEQERYTVALESFLRREQAIDALRGSLSQHFEALVKQVRKAKDHATRMDLLDGALLYDVGNFHEVLVPCCPPAWDAEGSIVAAAGAALREVLLADGSKHLLELSNGEILDVVTWVRKFRAFCIDEMGEGVAAEALRALSLALNPLRGVYIGRSRQATLAWATNMLKQDVLADMTHGPQQIKGRWKTYSPLNLFQMFQAEIDAVLERDPLDTGLLVLVGSGVADTMLTYSKGLLEVLEDPWFLRSMMDHDPFERLCAAVNNGQQCCSESNDLEESLLEVVDGTALQESSVTFMSAITNFNLISSKGADLIVKLVLSDVSGLFANLFGREWFERGGPTSVDRVCATFTDYGQDVVSGVGDASLHGAVYRGLLRGLLLNYFARLLTSPLKFKDQVVALISDDWSAIRRYFAATSLVDEASTDMARGFVHAMVALISATSVEAFSNEVADNLEPRYATVPTSLLRRFLMTPDHLPRRKIPLHDIQRFLERRTRQAKKGPSVSGGGLMQDLLELCLDPASTDLTRAKPRKASVF